MSSPEEKVKLVGGAPQTNLLEEMKLLKDIQDQSGARKPMNSELWHACAGPLVNLPQVGTLAYYFPQGHSEQVAVSTKRSATTQIPNYPSLPPQLLCQVHNVTLHADKDTDEIYAQMSLQPVNSEQDVFPIPDFGLKSNKHPVEFFCKTLTASDTSTHGGFSVPRRAAEKLFPPLDYTLQPPTQELVVRDLHDNLWTFRHIYRGQPKRHLLTTGWSLFVGSKRLKAGDSVLFIRDEKSQHMVGIRRANRQQTTLPSSVLSADSMHIGVLAAAAHAAANRSPFTVFYNPRACPSEFVIPLSKFRKAVYGTQLSVGMRFGMMFETEESGKRRYMGTIVGIGDLDPVRWPGSNWRNLQVEWDEPGCADKQNRVSPWEIETPESLFIFPTLTSGFKRPLPSGFFGGDSGWGNLIKRQLGWNPQAAERDRPYPGLLNGSGICSSNMYSEQLIKMLSKPQVLSSQGVCSTIPQDISGLNGFSTDDVKVLRATNQSSHQNQVEVATVDVQRLPQVSDYHCEGMNPSMKSPIGKMLPAIKVDDQKQGTSVFNSVIEPDAANAEHLKRLASEAVVSSLSSCGNQLARGHNVLQPKLPSAYPLQALPSVEPLQPVHLPAQDGITASNNQSAYISNACEWVPQLSPYGGSHRSPLQSPFMAMPNPSAMFPDDSSTLPLNHDNWDQLNNMKFMAQSMELNPLAQQPTCSIGAGKKDWSDESNNQSGIYNSLNVDASNSGEPLLDPSVSSAMLDDFCSTKNIDTHNQYPDCFTGNISSNQDLQSQITSVSLAESQAFSRQDLPDSSGGTSCSNVDFEKNNLYSNSSWQPISTRVRTYTKVQKAGSVGRSIDVTSFKNYDELCAAIECMFGLEGLLNNPRGSGWKLVYVDYENDVLLIGDDPWEEFVGCVRCIKILSPSEVQQMSEEGMKLLKNASLQGIGGSVADCTFS